MIQKTLTKIAQILGINYIIQSIQKNGILPSGVLLVIVNLIPILGVLFLGWNAQDIVVLYWVENIVIGICTIPRILIAQGVLQDRGISNKAGLNFLLNFFQAGFFMFHFGMFTLVHGVFLNFFILPRTTFFIEKDFTGIGAFFLALLISHGFSLIYNYIIKEEYENTNATVEMMKPYTRIFIIQFTIIFGVFISFISSDAIIIVFVLAKIVFDLGLHLKSHLGDRKASKAIPFMNNYGNYQTNRSDSITEA